MPSLLALVFFLSFITTALPVASAELPVSPATQLDLAKKLIDTFGWSEGLPENPAEKDYLAILGGKREFRFEAEEIYDRETDTASVKDYPLYGAFSGGGWLNGTSVPTAVHFRALMPIPGEYTLSAAGRGGEQLWSIAGRAIKIGFENTFSEKKLGKIFIPSGFIDFNALIPPAAGLDYILFSAPAYAAIEPSDGWRFKAPLTATVLAETVSSMLGNEQSLPDDTSFAKKTIEALQAKIPASAELTDKKIYGQPVAAKWVRALQAPVSITVPVDIDKNGVYTLRIRCMGTEISAGFGARKVTVTAKPYLEWIDLGTFRLKKGVQNLEVLLPTSGGIDLVEIGRKLSGPAEYMALNKIGGKEDSPVLPGELDTAIKSLQETFTERK